jgi:glycosyltransferase involved in cell wall biosynthesis
MSRRSPRLGIVTTVYNHAQYLPESLGSVASQTDARYVHVVVDDASPDGAWPIIEAYAADQTHRVALRLTENRGLAAAFHAGVDLLPPSVEWILKVDADDKIDERYVEEILRAAKEDSHRNVIFAPCQHFGSRSDPYYYGQYKPDRVGIDFMVPGPAAYRRSLWDAVGGYDVTMRSAEDWDFYVRCERAVGLVPYEIATPGLFWYYRAHAGTRASSHGMARMRYLRAYWQGHTRETVLARSRTWGAWCAEREVAA